jgi:protein-arginine kinase activator protein McsA
MGKKEKEKKDKPLDKMTAPELRTIAKELPDVAGVHGMNKTELLKVIKKARGIDEAGKGKNGKSVRDLKVKIRELKAKKEAFVAESDHKMTDIVRRRISRLKKKTRNAA